MTPKWLNIWLDNFFWFRADSLCRYQLSWCDDGFEDQFYLNDPIHMPAIILEHELLLFGNAAPFNNPQKLA